MTGIRALVLDVITYIGCGVSIVALIATLAIFLGFRYLYFRQKATNNNFLKIVQGIQKVMVSVFLTLHISKHSICNVKLATFLEKEDSWNYLDTKFDPVTF